MSKAIDSTARVFVAGHRGLVGSALVRALRKRGFANLIIRDHAELDLTDQRAVQAFFALEKPDHVFLAAARVGGIHANNTFPAEFISENLAIQTNVVHEAWRSGVKRLLFLGSSCIYPRDCPQPMAETHLLTGPLEATNRPYALAKIAGIEMCWAYNRQYGTGFIAAMPTNLYGPGDNYDLQTSHVIPAMIRKFCLAKLAARGDFDAIARDEAYHGPIPPDVRASIASGGAEVLLWGTGAPRREFLHSDDLADACLHLMQLSDETFQTLLAADRNDGLPPIINVGAGQDIALRELAQMIRAQVGFDGRMVFDPSRPDGTPRKLLDTALLQSLGWRPRIGLREGLGQVITDYFLGLERDA